jgi:hypothetical protein
MRSPINCDFVGLSVDVRGGVYPETDGTGACATHTDTRCFLNTRQTVWASDGVSSSVLA